MIIFSFFFFLTPFSSLHVLWQADGLPMGALLLLVFYTNCIIYFYILQNGIPEEVLHFIFSNALLTQETAFVLLCIYFAVGQFK